MAAAIHNGYEDVTVADVVPYVKEQVFQELQEMNKALPDDVIDSLLGKDVLDRRRQRRVKRAKKKVETPSEIKQTGEAEVKKAQAQAAKEDKPKSSKDFFKSIGSY